MFYAKTTQQLNFNELIPVSSWGVLPYEVIGDAVVFVDGARRFGSGKIDLSNTSKKQVKVEVYSAGGSVAGFAFFAGPIEPNRADGVFALVGEEFSHGSPEAQALYDQILAENEAANGQLAAIETKLQQGIEDLTLSEVTELLRSKVTLDAVTQDEVVIP